MRLEVMFIGLAVILILTLLVAVTVHHFTGKKEGKRFTHWLRDVVDLFI